MFAFSDFYFNVSFAGVLVSYILLVAGTKIASFIVLNLHPKISAVNIATISSSLRLIAFIVQSTLLFQLIIMESFWSVFQIPPYDFADFSGIVPVFYAIVTVIFSVITICNEICFFFAVSNLMQDKIILNE